MERIEADFKVAGERIEADFRVRDRVRIEADFVVGEPEPSNPMPVLKVDELDPNNLACPPATSTLRAMWGDLRTGRLLGQFPLIGATYSDIYNGAGAIGVTVPLVGPKPIRLEPWRSTLWIEENGKLLKGGIFFSRQVDGDTVTFTGEGFHSYLRRRHILSSLELDADQSSIAAEIVGPALDDIRADLEAPLTGVTRVRNYPSWENKNVAEAFEQLAAVDNGFDFRWSHDYRDDGTPGTTLEIDYPATGRQTGVTYEHLVGGIEIEGLATDGSIVANTGIASGVSNDADTPRFVHSDQAGLSRYVPLETVDSYGSVSSLATLAAHARRNVQRRRQPRNSATVVYRGPDRGERVGDRARIKYNYGIVSEDFEARITEKAPDWTDGQRSTRLTVAPIEAFE